jgi:hypothetical protein
MSPAKIGVGLVVPSLVVLALLACAADAPVRSAPSGNVRSSENDVRSEPKRPAEPTEHVDGAGVGGLGGARNGAGGTSHPVAGSGGTSAGGNAGRRGVEPESDGERRYAEADREETLEPCEVEGCVVSWAVAAPKHTWATDW